MRTIKFTWDIGDKVYLTDIDRPGVVTGLLADRDGMQYRIVWWSDGQRRCEWLYDFELRK